MTHSTKEQFQAVALSFGLAAVTVTIMELWYRREEKKFFQTMREISEKLPELEKAYLAEEIIEIRSK